MPALGPTREQFYAHLRAHPPYEHPLWRSYVVACASPGSAKGEPQFGRWLARKHPKQFADDFERWQKPNDPAQTSRAGDLKP